MNSDTFKRSVRGTNSEFSFSDNSYLMKFNSSIIPKFKQAGRRTLTFIPFQSVIERREISTASTRLTLGSRVHFQRRKALQ